MTDTRWNGEPCTARQITATVADNTAFPLYWARHLVGTRRNIIEVTYGDQTFYLDDEANEGWHKVTHGGSPRFAHSNIAIDPDSIRPREEAESETPGLTRDEEHEASGMYDTSSAATEQRVIALYEQWVKAGPPPLGASMARWWDTRLAELRTAISEQPARTTANNPATSSDTADNSPKERTQ